MNERLPKKKILLLSANPLTTGRLRLDEEMREIKEGLCRAKEREQFLIESVQAVRYRDLRRQILDVSPNIVHFSGHGGGEAGLVFEDESGQVKLIKAEALAGLFELFADSIECVVLNACYSEIQAKAISQHIPYVVGMGKAIGDKAAIEFAIAFYDAIGAGKDYEFAYKLACNGIDLAGILESETPKLLKKEEIKPSPSQPKQPSIDNKMDILQLKETLRSLTVADFNDLIDILEVSAGQIPPSNANQASRVDGLLEWAKSPTGCGLERLDEVLKKILKK